MKCANLHRKRSSTIRKSSVALTNSNISQSAVTLHGVTADCFDCSGRRGACKSTSCSRHGCLYRSFAPAQMDIWRCAGAGGAGQLQRDLRGYSRRQSASELFDSRIRVTRGLRSSRAGISDAGYNFENRDAHRNIGIGVSRTRNIPSFIAKPGMTSGRSASSAVSASCTTFSTET